MCFSAYLQFNVFINSNWELIIVTIPAVDVNTKIIMNDKLGLDKKYLYISAYLFVFECRSVLFYFILFFYQISNLNTEKISICNCQVGLNFRNITLLEEKIP